MAAAGREYFERLQSLRGFGLVMVAWAHCQGVVGGELPLQRHAQQGIGTAEVCGHYLAQAIFNGHGALAAFFVLSGFVLTLSWRRGAQAGLAACAGFAMARLFRIIPATAVAVLVAAAIAAWTGAAPQALERPPWAASTILANMVLVRNQILPVTWSLTVELLAVPIMLLLYLAMHRWGPVPLTLAIAISVPLSFSQSWLGYRPLSRNLFAILLGIFVAERGRALAAAMSRRGAVRCWLVCIVLFLASRSLFGSWSHWATVIEAGVAATGIALLAYGPELPGRWLFEMRPILWLGEISYSLYVYHGLLWPWFVPAGGAARYAWLGGWASLAAVCVAAATSLCAIIPIAWLAHALVERNGIRAGHRAVRHWIHRAAPVEALSR